jgi:drug/metabolite transporter (DMT)-like permease
MIGNALLSVVLAFAGNSLINIGQATQKIGVGVLSAKRGRGMILWVTGLASIVVANFFILYAVKIGSVAVVGAMAGSGLASLTLFSYFVMHERINKRELAGVVVIFSAAAVLGAFSRDTGEPVINLLYLFIFCGVIAAAYPAAILFTVRNREGGALIGAFAGAVGGLIPLFQKVSTSAVGVGAGFFDLSEVTGLKKELLTLFTNPYAVAWVAISFLAFLITQFAYKRGKAIRIIPAYAANFIMVPVIGGLLCFGERLNPWQWAGLLGIIGGLFLLTIRTRRVKA